MTGPDSNERSLELYRIFNGAEEEMFQAAIEGSIQPVRELFLDVAKQKEEMGQLLDLGKLTIARLYPDKPNPEFLASFTVNTLVGMSLLEEAERYRNDGEEFKEKACIDGQVGIILVCTPFENVTSPSSLISRIRRQAVINKSIADRESYLNSDMYRDMLERMERRILDPVAYSLTHDPTGFAAMDVLTANIRLNPSRNVVIKGTLHPFAIAGAELARDCYKAFYPAATIAAKEN